MRRVWIVMVVFVACRLLIAAPVRAEPTAQKISLRFSDTEISVVLSTLASQVGFDAVIGPGIEGVVSVNLTDVNWETALEAIVTANGLTYQWTDNVLVVLAKDTQLGGTMVHEIVQLKHADPVAIQAILEPVLSTNASVAVLGGGTVTEGQSNASTSSVSPILLVTETPYHMPEVLDVIAELDRPRPQFEISVRFVETSLDDRLGVGFSWPTRVDVEVADRSSLNSTTGTNNTSNQRIPAAEYPIPDGKIWRFGTLSIDQLSGFLEFLEQNGHSKLLSDPRVTVLENETAEMDISTTYPVQTISRFTEGASTQDIVDYYDIDVGISLKVTPRLNDSGRVTLQVEPSVAEVTGFTGPPDNQRPITANRRVKTAIRVHDKETLVIGGLVREVETATDTKVWLLGDIPLLGSLFRHKKSQTQKTDLLIFITPRILADAGTP